MIFKVLLSQVKSRKSSIISLNFGERKSPNSYSSLGNHDFFNKNYRVEAFDSTAVVIAGGLDASGSGMLMLTSMSSNAYHLQKNGLM